MIVRPAGRSFEVFMLRRSAKSQFAPDVFVFPGGTVDAADYAEQALARIAGLDDERLNRMYRAAPAPLLSEERGVVPQLSDARALLVAALRETFEEAGVLLGARAIDRLADSTLHDARTKLLAGALTFAQLLTGLDIFLDAHELQLFSQWITPPSEGRRFNAHFYIARADGQHALADRFETHDEIWITPQSALERYAAGTYAMVYPTIKHIERLAKFSSIDEVLAFSAQKPILRIMPNTTQDNGFALPGELEYAW